MAAGKQAIYVRSGLSARVYAARNQLSCDTCGRAIEVGSYFSRQSLPVSGTVRIACVTCRPFQITDLDLDEASLSFPGALLAESDATTYVIPA